MSEIGDAVMVPVIFLIYAIMDYALWSIFQALAGANAIWLMLGTIIVEVAALMKMIKSVGE